ncbi:uncharacterized protein [Choristoneura fumiferana]|uniref:uncharacterized protein n=1 Tax=Choristoneura fumiferana TaxID=7141 RepID=UPI003D15BE0A
MERRAVFQIRSTSFKPSMLRSMARWLTPILNFRASVKDQCTEPYCEAYCSSSNSQTSCQADNCKANSHGANSKAECKGDNCKADTNGAKSQSEANGQKSVASCIGASCKSECSGQNCEANCFGASCKSECFGENCEVKCKGANCKEIVKQSPRGHREAEERGYLSNIYNKLKSLSLGHVLRDGPIYMAIL